MSTESSNGGNGRIIQVLAIIITILVTVLGIVSGLAHHLMMRSLDDIIRTQATDRVSMERRMERIEGRLIEDAKR